MADWQRIALRAENKIEEIKKDTISLFKKEIKLCDDSIKYNRKKNYPMNVEKWEKTKEHLLKIEKSMLKIIDGT